MRVGPYWREIVSCVLSPRGLYGEMGFRRVVFFSGVGFPAFLFLFFLEEGISIWYHKCVVMWGNFLSVGSITCDSMGRYFIGRYFLCLNFEGRDSLVFLSFAVPFFRIVSFFSVRKFIRDFYNVKYTMILNETAVSSISPPHFFIFWPLFVLIYFPPFTSISLLTLNGGSFHFFFFFFFLPQEEHTHTHTQKKHIF